MKAVLLGGLASVFFALTFILNRSMELSGGSWIWSASLRFIFMVPFLFGIVVMRGNLRPLFKEMRLNPWRWLLWSFVGFVLFYAPITFAAAYGPGWLTAGTWQITVIAGVLLSPFFKETVENAEGSFTRRQKVPVRSLLTSFVILAGVALIQIQHAQGLSLRLLVLAVLPVTIAAFAYPLGNRKMMALCGGRLDPFQRVLGMTLASLPFWLLLDLYGVFYKSLPAPGQVEQSFIVALSSGVIATVLFFRATDMVKDDSHKLAAVEATQSGEVIFSLLGGILLLSGNMPSGWSLVGLMLIVGGMLLHSFVSRQREDAAGVNRQMEKTASIIDRGKF